jgi:hypothetical protein
VRIVRGDDMQRDKVRRTFRAMAGVREQFETQRGDSPGEILVSQAFAEFAAAGEAFDDATAGDVDFEAIQVCCRQLEKTVSLLDDLLR